MLTSLRELLRTNSAKLLFAIIVLAMGAWGFSGAFSGIMGDSQIRVAGRKLDAVYLENRVEQYLRNQSQETGKILTPQEAVVNGLVREIYDYEVFRFAHLKYADQIGITTSDDAVINTVQDIEGFLDPSTGTYSPQFAREALANAGMTIAEFERDLRDDLTIETFNSVVSSGIKVPQSMANIDVRYVEERRSVTAILVDGLTDFMEYPTEEDARPYYDENPQEFRQPERRRVDMLILSKGDYFHKVDFDEDELRAYYESVKLSQFSGVAKRKIFEASFSSQEFAKQALGKIAIGTKLANDKNSTYRTRTITEDDFTDEKVASQVFDLNVGPGQIIGPIMIDNVWSIIRIEEVLTPEVIPYSDAKDDLEAQLAEQQSENLYFEAIGRIDDLIGVGMNLRSIADELVVPLISLASFDERGYLATGEQVSPLVSTRGLLEEIFSIRKDYLTDWQNENGIVLIVQLVDIIPAHLPSFEDALEDAKSKLWSKNTKERVETKSNEILARLVSGESTFVSEDSRDPGVHLLKLEEAYTRESIDSSLPITAATNIFFGKEGDIFVTEGGNDLSRLIVRIDSITQPKTNLYGIEMARAASRLKQDLGQDIATATANAVFEKTKFRADRRAITQYESQVMSTQ